MKNLKNATSIEVRNEKNNVVADTFGVSDLVTNIFQAQVDYAERRYDGENETWKYRYNSEKNLQTLRKLCKKNKLNLVAKQNYSRRHKYDECIAYIIYSLERESFFTVSRSTAEWYTPEEFLELYDHNKLIDNYFVDPEKGVGEFFIENGIVSVENFGAIECIPGALYEFLTDNCYLESELADYVDD